MKILITTLLCVATTLLSYASPKQSYDVVIVGGGASGTAAGVQAARMGARTLIIEQYDWLGGMLTAAGVSATDGNYKLRGGFWGELRDSLEAHYGGQQMLRTGWVSYIQFEPSVGNSILKNIAGREKNLTIWYNSTPTRFKRRGKQWQIAVDNRGTRQTITSKIVIDATELGDIAKLLGVKYEIGMDSREVTNEDIAPEQENDIIQDLTYVMVLKEYDRDMTISRPEGYDPTLFYCTCLSDKCVSPKEGDRVWSKEMMITYGKLPNNKYMINWPIEGNDYYLNIIEMSPTQREDALKKAKNHSLCYLYYMQTELGYSNLGLADDEFPTSDMLPFIPYHRESRRIDGVVRFTLNDVCRPYSQPTKLYRTTIGVGDYPVDHHHARYTDWAELPNLHFYPIPSYGLPLGVMIPRSVDGLIVAEKSISVTNIVNGSTRLQPVVLQIGQAAGTLAALACRHEREVRDVSVRDVQREIIATGGYLLPFLDRPSTDPCFKAMQRIGATGIIKGHGANVGWENQTWFDADSMMVLAQLLEGMTELYPNADFSSIPATNNLNISVLSRIIAQASNKDTSAIANQITELWHQVQLTNLDPQRALTRLECAVVIDRLLNPFETIKVDITGNFIR